jgi:hypothetical protein
MSIAFKEVEHGSDLIELRFICLDGCGCHRAIRLQTPKIWGFKLLI